MRKVMLLAAMLAMVLAAAAPAFGQATAIDEGNTGDQYVVDQENEQAVAVNESICTNVAQAAQNQYNAGDQNAATTGDGDITQVANAANVTQAQVNECFNSFPTFFGGGDIVKTVTASAPADNDVVVATTDDDDVVTVAAEEDDTTTVVAEADDTEAVIVDEGEDTTVVAEADDTTTVVAAEGELPSTGGASVLALGAGVLLVAGGLVARRIVR